MATSPQPMPQPAHATAQAKAPLAEVVTAAREADKVTLNAVEKNPIFASLFRGDVPKEQRKANIHAMLKAGLADGTATPEEMDRRSRLCAEMIAAIQVIRKQLGMDQAHAITSKEYADFQAISDDSNKQIELFEAELDPLCDLAALFTEFGADGNLIENMQRAKAQKEAREERIAQWWADHEVEMLAYRRSVTELRNNIAAMEVTLDSKWMHKGALEAKILNAKADLAEREQQLATAQAKTPPEEQASDNPAVQPISEEVLKLRNIGGEEFKKTVISLRDHTEETLAKIGTNFDAAIKGLTNSRASFITMDRNATDAIFALSILLEATQQAESESREIAQRMIAQQTEATGANAELDRMEREQRSEQILGYTASLTTFITDLNLAISSLRSGKAVLQTLLRMNQMALEQANTAKITGIANTADAVTITIASIIEVCNRGASQILAETNNRIKTRAEQGSARLVGGTVESLQQQNIQMQGIVDGLKALRDTTVAVRKNTVGLLKNQFDLVARMHEESAALADATTEAQHATFDARAGVLTEGGPDKKAEPAEPEHAFSLRMGQPA